MRKFAAPTILALTATAAVLGAQGAPAQGLAAAEKTPTHFAMKGVGFGTRGSGGQLPAGTDTTAYQVIGCTNKAGIVKENHVETTTVPGLGKLHNVTTKVWTTSKGGVVASHSKHSIERLTIASSGVGSLAINAITSTARAFHNAKGFHAKTATHVGSLVFTPTGGDPQQVAVPTPDQPAVIPGLATIAVGDAIRKHGNGGAKAAANAIDITVIPTATRARVAHTATQIGGGVKTGLFRGFSSGTRAKGLQGNASVGYTPLQIMPCQGTGGQVRTKSILRTDLGDNILVRKASTRELGVQIGDVAKGYERGQVSSVEFGNQDLVIRGIIGQANVKRVDGRLVRNAKGTTIGSVTVNGEVREFPDTDVLNIPGVARLERNIVVKLPRGLAVTALRVTLLDGSGAVVNLGQAQLAISNSGN